MGFLGLDILAIRYLSRQLETQASEVDSAARELAALIAGTDWFGADQAAFMNDWNSVHAPDLRTASALLREASASAIEGAQAQERASSA